MSDREDSRWWPRRIRDWRSEWRAYSDLVGWRLWIWAVVASFYWARHPRLWKWWVEWWVDQWGVALLRRRRIERRLRELSP